jgi:hypothetical protein
MLLLSVLSHWIGEKNSVCFETGERMDSFAAMVVPKPGYSGMYEAKCELTSHVNE